MISAHRSASRSYLSAPCSLQPLLRSGKLVSQVCHSRGKVQVCIHKVAVLTLEARNLVVSVSQCRVVLLGESCTLNATNETHTERRSDLSRIRTHLNCAALPAAWLRRASAAGMQACDRR